MKKRPVRWSHRIECHPEDPFDVELHLYLVKLGETQDAMKWMKETLYNALPNRQSSLLSRYSPRETILRRLK